jgi:2-polyprenyl-3-methyl-5-hydroxy-6-metoxy-1,4-benzoquinol methylase
MKELDKLQLIASEFGYSRGIMQSSIKYCFNILESYLVPGSILELGPAEGVMTELLFGVNKNLTIVEGSTQFCDLIKNKFPTIDVFNSMFEEFKANNKFNNIVLSHVLEHVEDPASLLLMAKDWLAPGGIIFAAVPNASSIHRQAAVIMGLLKTENTLNTADIDHGHRRVFNPDEFKKIFNDTSLTVKKFGGYWLKPLANKQIEENWTPEMLMAFMKLGERYPDIAGEIYVVASN